MFPRRTPRSPLVLWLEVSVLRFSAHAVRWLSRSPHPRSIYREMRFLWNLWVFPRHLWLEVSVLRFSAHAVRG